MYYCIVLLCDLCREGRGTARFNDVLCVALDVHGFVFNSVEPKMNVYLSLEHNRQYYLGMTSRRLSTKIHNLPPEGTDCTVCSQN